MNKTLKIIICILCACILVTASVIVYNKYFYFHKDEVVENVPKEDDSKDIIEIDEEGITIVDDSEENVTDTKEDTNKGRTVSNSTTSSNTTSNGNTSSSTNTNNNNSSNNNSNNNTSVPAHVHEVVVFEAVEPTCEEDGLTEGSKCKTCGAILQAQEVIPKLNHSYGTDGKCIKCGAPSPNDSKEINLPKVKIK